MTDVFITSLGEQIPVIFETRRGLRNICIRPKTLPVREIHISVPWLTSRARAVAFLTQKRIWVEKIFARAPQKLTVHDGDIIEIFGAPVQIRHDPIGRAGVYMDSVECGVLSVESGSSKVESNGKIIPHSTLYTQHSVMVVCGAADMLERRVRDEIKRQFLARTKAEFAKFPLEFRPDRITVRDTTSRWGSCSSSRAISLSYRLAFAPYDVMRYVIAHEAAHLKRMDHSPKFWATVGQLYGPGYENAKRWLSQNGQSLHRWF